MPITRAQPAARIAPDEAAAAYRKVSWRLLPFLGLCLMMSSLDRVNISFAKLQMLGDLGMSEAAYGIGAGVFFLGYIPFEVPSNAILRRVGARVWIARIMVTWGLCSGLMMFVRTPAEFYLLRFLLGMAEAGGLPGILYYLSGWFPAYRRSRMIGLLMLGSPLSNVIGAPLSGWIMSGLDGVAHLRGWQWLFVLEALPSIVLGLNAFALLPAGPAEARWLDRSEKDMILSELAAETAEAPPGAHRFRDALANPRIWLLGGIDFSILLTMYAVGFWLPTFIRNAGETDLVRIGLLAGVSSLGGVIGLLLLPASSDGMRERRWHIVVPFLIAAAALTAVTQFLDNVAMIVICFTIAMTMVTGTVAVFFTLPATLATGATAAAGFAIACSVANIAGAVANPLIGYAIELAGTPAKALLLFAASLCASCLIVLSLPPRVVNR